MNKTKNQALPYYANNRELHSLYLRVLLEAEQLQPSKQWHRQHTTPKHKRNEMKKKQKLTTKGQNKKQISQ